MFRATLDSAMRGKNINNQDDVYKVFSYIQENNSVLDPHLRIVKDVAWLIIWYASKYRDKEEREMIKRYVEEAFRESCKERAFSEIDDFLDEYQYDMDCFNKRSAFLHIALMLKIAPFIDADQVKNHFNFVLAVPLHEDLARRTRNNKKRLSEDVKNILRDPDMDNIVKEYGGGCDVDRDRER